MCCEDNSIAAAKGDRRSGGVLPVFCVVSIGCRKAICRSEALTFATSDGGSEDMFEIMTAFGVRGDVFALCRRIE